MPTFAQIQDEIAGMLEIPDEELTEEQRKTMDEYLSELGEQESGKVDSFGQFIRIQSEHAEALRKEAKRLTDRARAAENRIDSLKNYYLDVMQKSDLKKVSGDVYTISVRETSVVSVTTHTEEIPSIYVRTKVIEEPDKLAIKEALKEGVEVPGCSLIKSKSLQIK